MDGMLGQLEQVCVWHGQLSSQLELVELIRAGKSDSWPKDASKLLKEVTAQLEQAKTELQRLDIVATSQPSFNETETSSERDLEESRLKKEISELAEQLTALRRPLNENLELDTQLVLQECAVENLDQDISEQQTEAELVEMRINYQKKVKEALSKRLTMRQPPKNPLLALEAFL